MSALLLLATLLPLLGGVVEVVWPRARGTVMTASAALGGILLAPLFGDAASVSFSWADLPGLRLTFGLSADGLSMTIALLVLVVVTGVSAYAVAYLGEEPSRHWFFGWLGLFTAAMVALVLASSLLVLFFAWEIVGVTSYALIAFHHRDPEARRSARRAFLFTRAADTGLLLAWLWLSLNAGTTDITTVERAALDYGSPALLGTTAVLIVIGAAGKSAQLPFSTWLPAAMVAPTPVSALLHSATMVAAGVYLLLRLNALISATGAVLYAVMVVGAATALFAAIAATMQADLKRLLAWSTVSQLGEMFFAVGLGAWFAAAFHLVVHAVFKAGLFLVAGAIERSTGTRDLRELGAIQRALPVLASTWALLALTLAAIPPFSGFFSGDAILKAAADRGPGWAFLLVVNLALAGLYIGRPSGRLLLAGRKQSSTARVGLGFLVPIAAFTLAALVVGALLEKPLDAALPFSAAAGTHVGWSVAAVLAALLGLAVGVLAGSGRIVPVDASAWHPPEVDWARGTRVLLAIPRLIDAIERRVDGLAGALARRVVRVAEGVETIESRGFSVAAAKVAEGTIAGAQRIETIERHVFSNGSDRLADGTLAGAQSIESVERHTFSNGGDRLAAAVRRSGQALANLQRGRVALNSASLFVSAIALAVLALFIAL